MEGRKEGRKKGRKEGRVREQDMVGEVEEGE